MNINVIDIETYWDSKDYTLSKMGPIDYARDIRAHCQMLGVSGNGGPAYVACEFTGCDVRNHLAKLDLNDVYVAHNGAGFDFIFLAENFGFRPRHMWDNIFMARWVGLSSICAESHAAITEFLGHGVKRAGTDISNGKHWPGDFTEAERVDFTRYCAEDVAQCALNIKVMLPYLTEDCLTFMSLTARMATEPVLVADEAALADYLRKLEEDAERARQELMAIFHFNNLPEFFKALRSADKFASMLRELGVEPPVKVSEKKTATAIQQAEAVGDIERANHLRAEPIMSYAFSKSDVDFLDLREHEDPRVRLLVETRLEFNSSIMRSRAETFLKFANQKKPIPITLSAFKAHTSRYSAGSNEGKTDGLQWQNLSKRNPAYKPLRKAIHAPAGHVIVAVDSSQVEARCLAWAAQQTDLLDQFRTGRDPYAELATRLTTGYTAQQIHDGAKADDPQCKHWRNLGKTFVLSAGYGVGAARVAQHLLKEGIKLSPNRADHNRMAANYLQIYRRTNYAITRFWDVCRYVIEALARGESGQFGGPNGDVFKFGMMPVLGRWPVPSIIMPSGYALRYPNLRAQTNQYGKLEYVYDTRKGKNVVPTKIYGGLGVNNCIQCLSFQILQWQACRMYNDGVKLHGNIHDCWFSVVPESQAQAVKDKMLFWMSQVPPWAEGLPIAAEAEIGTDFSIC